MDTTVLAHNILIPAFVSAYATVTVVLVAYSLLNYVINRRGRKSADSVVRQA